MARYPALPQRLNDQELLSMYKQIQRWGSVLINELDSRDLDE